MVRDVPRRLLAKFPGFEVPDGVNQWPALSAAAAGTLCTSGVPENSGDSPASPTCPRTEVVLDLNPDGEYFALRYKDYKVMWGKVGVADVIPDVDYDCSSCCPLRRHFPATPGTGECTAAHAISQRGEPPLGQKHTELYRSPEVDASRRERLQQPREYWEPHEHYTVAPGAPCASRASPCVFNVATDVNESHNLFGVAAYKAVVDELLSRVDGHLARVFNYSIDHTNITAAQYCDIVEQVTTHG